MPFTLSVEAKPIIGNKIIDSTDDKVSNYGTDEKNKNFEQ